MNKQEITEARKRLDKIEAEAKALREMIENSEKEIIRVPDCIKIEKCCGDGDELGIRFPGYVLCSNTGMWDCYIRSSGSCISFIMPCKLLPTTHEAMEDGYTYYCTDNFRNDERFDILQRYRKYINGNLVGYNSESSPIKLLPKNHWNYVYQVVPIED